MAPATKTPTAFEALESLREQDVRVNRRRDAITEQLAAILGRVQQGGKRAGGEVAVLKSKISDEQGAAARDGREPDVRGFEAEIAAQEARAAALKAEMSALKVALDRLADERREVLTSRHREFRDHARGLAMEGEELLGAMAEAAAEVLAHRRKMAEAVALAAIGAGEDAKAFYSGFRPWAGSNTSEQAALWESVERASRSGQPAPRPADVDPAWYRSARGPVPQTVPPIAADRLRGPGFEVES